MSSPKKILISYCLFPPIAFELQEAFEALDIEIELFLTDDNEHWFYKKVIKIINKVARNLRLVKKGHDFFVNHRLNRLNYLSTLFNEQYDKFQPDFVFFIHGQAYANHILEKINKPKIAWWIEPCDDINELRIYAEPFDIYNSFSQKSIDVLNDEGFPTGYLCHAVSPRSFYPISNIMQSIDVAFVGNWSPWIEEVLKAVLKVTKNVALYGPHWKKKTAISSVDFQKIYKGNRLIGAELNHLFNESKIVLNASRFPGSSGLNMRFFEVPASGSCLLSDDVPELTRHFIPGEHLSVFYDLDDLALKLNVLLENSELRKNIRNYGYNHVLTSYTYEKLAKKILIQYEQVISRRDSI